MRDISEWMAQTANESMLVGQFKCDSCGHQFRAKLTYDLMIRYLALPRHYCRRTCDKVFLRALTEAEISRIGTIYVAILRDWQPTP